MDLLIRRPEADRRAVVRTPPDRTADPLPAVVVLHGAGGTAEWTEAETGFTELGRREKFVAVYPEALPPNPDRPMKFLTNPTLWDDGSPQGTAHPRRPDDVGFIAELLDRLTAEHAVDPARVYLTGFSNGAGMTFRLASAMAGRFAAIAPVAGLCRVEPTPSRPLRTLYLIGDSDPLIPLDGGRVKTPWRYVDDKPSVWESLSRWAEAIGIENAPEEVAVGDVRWLRYSAEMKAGVVAGLGHHWPGGSGLLPERYGGKPSKALGATAAIWEWFAAAS